MMKHIIKITLIITAFLLATCADLDETLRSGITGANYYTTEVGFEDLAASVYWPLWTGYGNYFNIYDHGTDIWDYGSGARQYLNSYDAGLNPSATSRNWFTIWVHYYKGINLANSVIGRADYVQDMSEARKTTLIAEARFLRAHYYQSLVQTHGGVHLTLEETFGVETEAYRSTEEEIWEEVIADLEFAAANLPVYQSQVGRATSGAAKALLARVHLVTKNWSEAATWSTEVIESGDYSLIDSYYTLWDPHEPHSGVGYNDETIFGLLLTPTSGDGNRDKRSRRFASRARSLAGIQTTHYTGNAVNRHKPTEFYVTEIFNNDPEKTDVPNHWNDERWSTSFKEVWYYNDPRSLPAGAEIGDTAAFFPTAKKYLEMTDEEAAAFAERGNFQMFRIKDWTDELYTSMALKFRWRGTWEPEYAESITGKYNHELSWRTEPIIRLAEMYLIASEAYMMMEDYDKGAEYFNVVRKRAEAPGYEIPLITPGELNIDEILNERHRELSGEGMTWFDLKRTGKLLERVRAHNSTAAPNIQEYHLLRPIPQAHIDRCTNEYPQNPGY